jgi:hypothetical protein
MKPVKFQKDTTLTIRINSLLKDHIQKQVEADNITLTDFFTNLAVEYYQINKNELTRAALGS